MFKLITCVVLFFVFGNSSGQKVLTTTLAQQNIDNILISRSNVNSIYRIMAVSKSGNSNNFLILSYFINSNNILYDKTKDVKYLIYNKNVIDNIINSGKKSSNDNSLVWVAKMNARDQNYSFNNKQFMLFEGYLLRYIAQYAYVLNKAKLTRGTLATLTIPISAIENNFMKWYDKSMKEYSDASSLFSSTVHIAAQWALTAKYLYTLSKNSFNKNIYKEIFTSFDKQFRQNLRSVKVSDHNCYIWNSQWKNDFTNYIKRVNKLSWNKSVIDDVTHGNHVVEYIIDSYKMGIGGWDVNDIVLLSNTLKYIIWQEKSASFSDNIDGTPTNDNTLKNTGWKQSDGWMKLMEYDDDLKKIYSKFYIHHQASVDKTYISYQFYAIFYAFAS